MVQARVALLDFQPHCDSEVAGVVPSHAHGETWFSLVPGVTGGCFESPEGRGDF